MDVITAMEKAIVYKVNRDLVELANQRIQGIQIEAFPDKPGQLGKPSVRARFLLSYSGSTFEETNEDPLTLTETVSFDLLLDITNLRTHQDAYPIIIAAKEALFNFAPLKGFLKPLRPKSIRFQSSENEHWYWVLQIECVLYSQYNYKPIDAVDPDQITEPGFPIILPDEFTLVAGLWRSMDYPASERTVLDQELRFEKRNNS